MDLRTLDLNLLCILDAVLETRHITRAAKKLGLSQSAVSHALSRLRRILGDDLLVRGPTGLVPTARALAMGEPLRTALAAVSRTLAPPEPFDPKTARRTFRIGAADYAQFVLLPVLLGRMHREAPAVSVWVTAAPPLDAMAATLASGELDMVVGVTNSQASSPGLYERALFEEYFVCMVRQGHPTVGKSLSLVQYAELHHAFIAPRGRAGGVVDSALAERGMQRHVALAVPHFLTIPHIIAASDLIVTLAARVAHAFAETLPLRILPPPLPLPPFKIGVSWHDCMHRDPGHVWLRDRLAAAGAAVAHPTRRANVSRKRSGA